ncbi:hypothetical protein C8Q80DRAFT_830298 [Daedaleopsis nitida]|nr:hypothetical protein C8Q80DRAFT_830298 [Daedaleopsis nitida]
MDLSSVSPMSCSCLCSRHITRSTELHRPLRPETQGLGLSITITTSGCIHGIPRLSECLHTPSSPPLVVRPSRCVVYRATEPMGNGRAWGRGHPNPHMSAVEWPCSHSRRRPPISAPARASNHPSACTASFPLSPPSVVPAADETRHDDQRRISTPVNGHAHQAVQTSKTSAHPTSPVSSAVSHPSVPPPLPVPSAYKEATAARQMGRCTHFRCPVQPLLQREHSSEPVSSLCAV